MIQKFCVRKMKKRDVPQVCLIERQIFSLPWSEQSFITSMEQEHTLYLVAEEVNTEQLAGYCGLYQSLDEADITNVAVKPEYRRQHVAEQMLRQLLDSAKGCGVERFTLEVRVSNLAAIALYTGLGFERAGIRRRFYEKPVEDAVIMWKYR